MPVFTYEAMDAKGKPTKGTLEVVNQGEALKRLKEMGFFPTKVVESAKGKDTNKKDGKDSKGAPAAGGKPGAKGKAKGGALQINIKIPGLGGGVNTKTLCTFTRQLATLVDAGLPLLRGLLVLQKQEKDPTLREILGKISVTKAREGSHFAGNPRQVGLVHRRRQHLLRGLSPAP